MRLKLIACKVMAREIGLLSARSQNYIDITYLRQGYHNTPELLREILQQELDLLDEGGSPYSCSPDIADFDAVLLGYGLCCNGIVGIKSKKYTLVVPKAHDCITLLLGSRERYRSCFKKYPGTYWYTAGWVENILPQNLKRERLIEKYTALYGEENAEYLADMECSWQGDYQNIIYIDWKDAGFPDESAYARAIAKEYDLKYHRLTGHDTMLRDFLDGKWDDRFLVVPPGCSILPSYDNEVIRLKGANYDEE